MSIYAGEPIEAVVSALGDSDGDTENMVSFSGRINTVCERYMLIMHDELKRIHFTKNEWCAIFDANNGVTISVGFPEGDAMMWANVADSPELDEKWGVNHADLALRMQAMTTAGRLAMREACDRFWSRSELTADEAIEKAGISLPAG